MSDIKDKYVKLAILVLILLDVFLVVYSCENRQRYDPLEIIAPVEANMVVVDLENGNDGDSDRYVIDEIEFDDPGQPDENSEITTYLDP